MCSFHARLVIHCKGQGHQHMSEDYLSLSSATSALKISSLCSNGMHCGAVPSSPACAAGQPGYLLDACLQRRNQKVSKSSHLSAHNAPNCARQLQAHHRILPDHAACRAFSPRLSGDLFRTQLDSVSCVSSSKHSPRDCASLGMSQMEITGCTVHFVTSNPLTALQWAYTFYMCESSQLCVVAESQP